MNSSSTFALVSALYHLHLDWCQFISSTFGFVSVYIIYVWVVSVYFIYIWIGVSLNCLRLYLVSVDTIYVWSSVSLQCLLLHWCQFISSMLLLVASVIKFISGLWQIGGFLAVQVYWTHLLALLLSLLVACDRLVVFSRSRCTGHIFLLCY